jgi:hypothetical protein
MTLPRIVTSPTEQTEQDGLLPRIVTGHTTPDIPARPPRPPVEPIRGGGSRNFEAVTGTHEDVTPEERAVQLRIARQIPSYVVGAARIFPAIALQQLNHQMLAGAYVAFNSPELIYKVVFGVPSAEQLQARRAELIASPDLMSREIHRQSSTRLQTVALSKGAVTYVPATAQDVISGLDAQIAEQHNVELSASAEDRRGVDVLNRVLQNRPTTSRLRAATNLAREVGSFAGPQALYLFGARVANDFRNAIKMSNDPNATVEETADTFHQAAQGTIILGALGGAVRTRINRARGLTEQIEAARIPGNEAEVSNMIGVRLSQIRQSEGLVETPVAQAELNLPRANLAATLIRAHTELRPDGLTVIPGVDNPLSALRFMPVEARPAFNETMAYHKKSRTLYMFGPQNPNNTAAIRTQIAQDGFYTGQRISYEGADYVYVGRLTRKTARIATRYDNPITPVGEAQLPEQALPEVSGRPIPGTVVGEVTPIEPIVTPPPGIPEQRTVNLSDIRITNTSENLRLDRVTQDAAFNLYKQWKSQQPEGMGDREINALVDLLANTLGIPKTQVPALRHFIVGREATELEHMTPEEDRAWIENFNNTRGGDLGESGTSVTREIINPSGLRGQAAIDYRTLERVKEMTQFEAEQLKGTKVVDESGKPLVVYHGTPEVREQPLGHPSLAFDPTKTGPNNLFGQGAGYFTENPRVAGGEGENIESVGYATPKVTISDKYNESLIGLHLAEDLVDNTGSFYRNHKVGEYITYNMLSDADMLGYDVIKTVEQGTRNIYLNMAGSQVIPVRLDIRNPFDIESDMSLTEITRIMRIAQQMFTAQNVHDRLIYTLNLFRSNKAEDASIDLTGELVWNSIADAVEIEGRYPGATNKILRAAGYDGITHIGGVGKVEHRVWIPFDQSQIHSAWSPDVSKIETSQRDILEFETLKNSALSNGLAVTQVGIGYEIRSGDNGALLHRIETNDPNQVRSFINSVSQAKGEELVTDLNIPPEFVPPNLIKPLVPDGGDEAPRIPYQVTEHTLTERFLNLFRSPIFTGMSGQWKRIASMTKGTIDLESHARSLQESARLTDALIQQEFRKANIEHLEKLARSMTQAEHENVFRANETLSISEAERLAGENGIEYSNALLDLHSVEHPLDIRRVIEFTRHQAELRRQAKKEEWTDTKLDEQMQKLVNFYDFSPNNLAASVIVQAIRRISIKDVNLHDVVRLVEARMNPSEAVSRGEFMARKQFDSQMRDSADRIQKILETFADYNKIPDIRKIMQYMSHYRKQRAPIDDEIKDIITNSQPYAETIPGFEMFEKLVRTGEISVYDMNPVNMIKRYITSSVIEKNFKPIYDHTIARMNEQASRIPDAALQKSAKESIAYFAQGLLHRTAPEDMILNRVFKSFMTELGSRSPIGKKAMLNVSDRAVTNFINTVTMNMIGAFQGGKWGNAPRDVFNAIQMANAWFGTRVAIDVFNKSFGDVTFKDGRLDVNMLARKNRARELGIIGQEFYKRKPPIPKDHRNPVVQLAELYNRVNHIAVALSGQQVTHDVMSVGIYEYGRSRALDTLNELRGMANLTAETKTKFLNEHLDLDVFGPEFGTRFDTHYSQGTESSISEAAHIYGLEMIQKIMPPYGYAEQPRYWRSVYGRLLGLYGRFQIHIKDQLIDMASFGATGAKRRAAIERLLVSEGIRIGISKVLNVDSQNWSPLGIWQGSPSVQFYQDMADALRKNDEKKAMGILARIGASQVPFYSLMDLWNRAASPEEAMMRILLLIKPVQ